MKYIEMAVIALVIIGIICIIVFYQPAYLEVELNQEFRLEKNSVASIKNDDLSIKVTGFINSPCKEGAQCFWSGLKVEYTITYKGIEYDSYYGTPYVVDIVNSDYKTYAILKITKKITA